MDKTSHYNIESPADEIDLAHLQANTLIESRLWDGVARLRFIVPEAGHSILGLELDGEIKTISISDGQNHGIRIAKREPGIPWKAFVAVERLRHEYAKGLDTSGSADPLPHQLKTIYQVSGVPGRIRFMIADEPGGGKTIVASRIIQELFVQKQIKRVLIVAPALLKYQWQSELKRFVGINSFVIESGTHGRLNPWLDEDKSVLITSMDYAKQDGQMDMLRQAKFDLVVVDEAHNFNATQKNVTSRYKLGELLGEISFHMIFLTATPHRGKPENFRLLLKLLEPDLFDDPKMTEYEVFNRKARLFIRHTKDNMIGMDEKPLFLKREVVSIKYNMSDTERKMYDKVSEYVQRRYNQELGRDPSTIASFALLIIQKRMASSTHALLKSLKRRREKLEKRLNEWGMHDDRDTISDDWDSMTDEEREDWEERVAGATVAQNPDDLREEIKELDGLIDLAETTTKTKPDTKLEKLLSRIGRLGAEKLLIFSEYRHTLDYLEEKIREYALQTGRSGYDVCRIDGKMTMRDREDAQEAFRTHSQIMLATDAAREGINLQFCHLMINYDLPWSPISLEQRMGRLHRYGQKHDVLISNMVAAQTREGDVMETLFDKIHQIEMQYPTFNVMGQVLASSELEDIMTAAIRTGSTENISGRVEMAAERAKNVDKMLGRTPIDVKQVRQKMENIKAQRTDGQHLVNAIKKIFDNLGGAIRELDGKTTLVIPKELRYGKLNKKSIQADALAAELLARGGGIYNHLMEWVKINCSDDLKFGSVFRDPNGFDGWILFHTVRVLDKKQDEAGRLLVAHSCRSDNGAIQPVKPFILHEMEYDEGAEAGPAPLTDEVAKAAITVTRKETEAIVSEKKAFWDHRMEAVSKRNESEMNEISRSISETAFGPERDALIIKRDELGRKMEEIRKEEDMDTMLMSPPPVLEGWIRVVPTPSDDSDGDMDIEKIGMDASMEHERADGFAPKDVSGKYGIGYDIFSEHPDGRRREIEVKARCGMGGIQLTESEYNHVKNGKNSVIHVISNAGQPGQHLDVLSNVSGLRASKDTVYNVKRSEIHRLSDRQMGSRTRS